MHDLLARRFKPGGRIGYSDRAFHLNIFGRIDVSGGLHTSCVDGATLLTGETSEPRNGLRAH